MKIGLVILGIVCLAEAIAVVLLAKSNKSYKETNQNLVRQMRELKVTCDRVTNECEAAKSEGALIINHLDSLTEKYIRLSAANIGGRM